MRPVLSTLQGGGRCLCSVNPGKESVPSRESFAGNEMPVERPRSGHLIFPAAHQLRWQASGCLCSGGSSNKKAGKSWSQGRRQLGGSIPRATGCNVVALQPGGAERGSTTPFCVSGEGCPQEAAGCDVEDRSGVVAVTIPRRSRQGRFRQGRSRHSSHWVLWIQ